MALQPLVYVAPVAGACSILLAVVIYLKIVKKYPDGNEKMKVVTDAIREGAGAFLKRQYRTLGFFVAGIGALLLILEAVGFFTPDPPVPRYFPGAITIAYVLGSGASLWAGWFGMTVATQANTKSAWGATESINKGFSAAFWGGSVSGLAVVGAALLGVSLLTVIFERPQVVTGFSFGASTIALFAKAGGGIFTKTADIAADLVGKVELDLPEDDPRNPAVIADNVGDNVGDVAGQGADLFDSFVASIFAAMTLGAIYYETGVFTSLAEMLYPLFVSALGVFASIAGLYFVRIRNEDDTPTKALNRGTYFTTAIFIALLLAFTLAVNSPEFYFYFLAAAAGLLAGVLIGVTTDFFTNDRYKPVRDIALASRTGAATNILTGYSYGLLSLVPSLLGTALAMFVSYFMGARALPGDPVSGGLFGISMAAVGMLSIVGMIVATDSYGPIVDNAKGIAEQGGLSDEVITICDHLDSAGNTVKAVSKGFAIGAASLQVLALFAAYSEAVRLDFSGLSLLNPLVFVGVFVGALMPAIFSAFVILGVGKNANRMIQEVRRQFKEMPGIMAGTQKPDYARCVDIATVGALKELRVPSALSVAIPLAVGLLLGPEALGGLLAGAIITGIVFALLMSNAGGAWDNAKKYIEDGRYGGKGSEAHHAAVIGDTVGDPFKDTAGPALNTLLSVISLTATLFAPLILLIWPA
ncbi:MAG: sodium-translocating pyrophosphatase [Promethearchaeota archaeon]